MKMYLAGVAVGACCLFLLRLLILRYVVKTNALDELGHVTGQTLADVKAGKHDDKHR